MNDIDKYKRRVGLLKQEVELLMKEVDDSIDALNRTIEFDKAMDAAYGVKLTEIENAFAAELRKDVEDLYDFREHLWNSIAYFNDCLYV